MSGQEKKEDELKVRDFGFNLEELLGKGWKDKVEKTHNSDFYSVLAVKKEDRHVTVVELKDGREVIMMSAKVTGNFPLEQMELHGGGDFRLTENWLYAYNPKEKKVTIIYPEGQQTEIEASKEDFDAQMAKFLSMYQDGGPPIKTSGKPSTEKQEKIHKRTE